MKFTKVKFRSPIKKEDKSTGIKEIEGYRVEGDAVPDWLDLVVHKPIGWEKDWRVSDYKTGQGLPPRVPQKTRLDAVYATVKRLTESEINREKYEKALSRTKILNEE